MAAYQLARSPPPPPLLRTKFAHTTYIAPSSLSGWAAYYTRIFLDFQSSAQSIATKIQNVQRDVTRERTLPDLQTRSKLCVHVVAAADKEYTTLAMMEELLHFLSRFKTVVIIYIGPTLPARFANKMSVNVACNGCQQRGRRRMAIVVPATYHEFARSP
ncbi:hypothetical protein FB451DRAFT_1399171 [Mycena latifolia]|nr:hypothetical protein FB451DRAFT_1399171 [Mycena latifolia]